MHVKITWIANSQINKSNLMEWKNFKLKCVRITVSQQKGVTSSQTFSSFSEFPSNGGMCSGGRRNFPILVILFPLTMGAVGRMLNYSNSVLFAFTLCSGRLILNIGIGAYLFHAQLPLTLSTSYNWNGSITVILKMLNFNSWHSENWLISIIKIWKKKKIIRTSRGLNGIVELS